MKDLERTLLSAREEGDQLADGSFDRETAEGLDLSGCILDGVTLSASCVELRGAKLHASQAAVVARILGIEIIE